MIYPYVNVPVSYYIIKFGTDIIVNYYIGLIHFLAGNLKIPDGFGTSSLVYPQKKNIKKIKSCIVRNENKFNNSLNSKYLKI